MQGWKVLTHDWRPPVQGGEPVCDGKLPFIMPRVQVDDTDALYGPGWYFCERPETALGVDGLWPNGRPSLLLVISTAEEEPVYPHGENCRAGCLTLDRLATEEEGGAAVRAFSEPFGGHADWMAEEQMRWRAAMARPSRDASLVEQGLRAALAARNLTWTIERFDSAQAAWDAWDADDANDACDAWAVRDANAAWAAWAAKAPRAAWAVRDAWDARHPRDAWASRDAGAALMQTLGARRGWLGTPADLLTTGLRDAYTAGLGVAVPTGPNKLGYAMIEA